MRVPTFVAWAVRAYGYEVAVLDQDGQIIESETSEPGGDLNETRKFARYTASLVAEEHGIPLHQGRVFQDQELMPPPKEI